MVARIMQQASGKTRPLAFADSGQETLLHASAATPWAGVQLEVHRTMPGEAIDTGPVEGQHALVVFLEGSVEMTACKRFGESTYRAVPGSTAFLAGDERASTRVKGSAEVAAVLLSPEWLHRVDVPQAPDGFGRTPALVADETVRLLVSAMRNEIVAGGGTGRLYAESLSVALLSYVFDRIPLSRIQVRGTLSEAQRRRLTRHIRERLEDDLTLTELASLVGIGARQLSRLFRDAFGVSPHRYLLNQRLDEGARRLALGTQEIGEVALALGFCSQSHFAAAFRERFGETPRKYALERRRSRRYPA
jgi:AraC family transcriptional regulator